MAELCVLYSGSSGNSYFVGSKASGILVDIGRSAKQTTLALQRCGIDPLAIRAILITHEHSDHVSGLRVFATRYQIPVFASAGTLAALEDMGIANGAFPTHALTDRIQLDDMQVQPFHIPHDCAEGYGYRICTADDRHMVLATDMGYITPDIKAHLLGNDLTVIESNHDIGMLRTGPYPYSLKRRILSDVGHLSNERCAEILPELYHSGTRQFVLAHLSRENNTPDIARQTAVCGMQLAGITQADVYQLEIAPVENQNGHTIVF